LDAYAQMATKVKTDVDAALEKLVQIVNQDRNYVPALLGKFVFLFPEMIDLEFICNYKLF
jgi:hypothetical protein